MPTCRNCTAPADLCGACIADGYRVCQCDRIYCGEHEACDDCRREWQAEFGSGVAKRVDEREPEDLEVFE